MDSNIQALKPYPFARLKRLLANVHPPTNKEFVSLSIGEPHHSPSEKILDALLANRSLFSKYPPIKGTNNLRKSISQWLIKRYSLNPNAIDINKNILPTNGSREALFSSIQAIRSKTGKGTAIIPNPGYQIYEGATILSGLKPNYINNQGNGQPNYKSVSDKEWKNCQVCFICSPNNPTGKFLSLNELSHLIEMANKYDFWLCSDECYSEIFNKKAPIGLLEASSKLGNPAFKKCIVFQSLSKRSNVPGLRSGFVAGDSEFIEPFYQYRTYHGVSMPLPIQIASEIAWSDENHVKKSRSMYREKFSSAEQNLKEQFLVGIPDGGFFLWLKTPIPCEEFTSRLFGFCGVEVLPGSFLGREVNGKNPGDNFVRIALVEDINSCNDALNRIAVFCKTL